MNRLLMLSDRERWNTKFIAGEAQSTEPDPLLVEACSPLVPGAALDLAGGAGRHAIWLAQHEWIVTLTDGSDEGLAIATRRSAEAGVTLTFRQESAEQTIAWAAQDPGVRFDLIVVFWFLVREHFAALPGMLNPGGRLVYKTYTSDHVRFTEGHSLRYALAPGELRAAFPTLESVLSRESDGVAELVARAR
jgi:tellurite methyltransferase